MLALGVSPETIEIASQDAHQASETARTLEGQAEAAISSMPPEVQAKVRGVIKGYSDQLDAYAQHIASRAATDAATAASEIDQAYQRFEYWYNIGQERAQAWFTGHARLITVLWAVVFTLLLQLDTIEIFRLVSTNKTVRDKLVAEVSAVTDQAQRSIGANQTVLQDAVIDLAGQEPDPIKTRLLNFKVDPAATRDQVREQVRQLVFGATGSGDFADFDAAVDKEAGEHLEDTVHDYQTLRTSLDTTGFDLFPVGRWRWGPFWWSGFSLHWLGMLFSVALLSLGAPFWFNALKSLTNLRSAVAENIDAEQDGDGSSNSPPTPGKPAGQQPG
jgi:hypothetical protein